ncbi:insecticidal toxin complex protein TcaB2 [Pseudomonas brassicacearum]|uniref:Tc toxin subunit A-related protein n=1 Tax=Pseudomonas brassicacearum TaxID=930166 RepID=UPI00042F1511|nr:neuraminidase-like domain-containing protein [Pseudomonas brassicacearum]AHL35694.1 insecticidal toxin complex protein TcaB2 [Pseudomonas brassicacearum]
MTLHSMSELFEKRRNALIEYCLGQVGKGDGDSKYNFLRTPADLFELLRMDPLDSYPVQSSWVAEATSCAQQFIHAAYRKLEPGYEAVEFDKRDLATWELYSNYPDWAALQLITLYPENFITPFVRQRKTSLFKTLENNLNQAHLNIDSVQAALQDYLQTFEQTCNLDVLSSYMDGTPERADYYFVGRQRVPPFQYFWRKAEVELSPSCVAINPAAWSEWLPVDTPTGVRILDIRPVFWSGRLCLVWAEWQDKVESDGSDISLPHRLEIKVAFMSQNGQWSSPLSLHSSASEADLTPGARLIATIWADYSHPKGRLGVLLTNDKTKDKAEDDGGDGVLKVFAVRDVLFRPLAWDDGGWLEQAAKVRFVDANTVQHPLMNQPRVSPSVETAGRLTPFLDLQAVAFRVDNDDVLFVQGFLRPSGETEGQDETFDLTLEHAETGDQRYEDEHPVAGGWSTDWLVFRRSKGSWGDATFSFGTKKAGYGRKKFVLGISNVTAFAPVSLLKNGLDAAQFLSLNQPELTLKYTRLNSLFGPELVQRSNVSVDAVLDWDTQFLPEPPPGTGPINEPNGAFDGANGLFFWELFFHLPHLVAARLRAEDRFLESQNWLHYLFDPQAPADATQPLPPNPRPLYWRCRPLAGPGNLGCETMAPTDPDAIAYSAPKHFQILVFCDYVKNLIAWGDWYYRQLTRDSLVAAKLCYVQAEFLMGKAPSVQTVNRWEADTVNSLMHKSTSRPALEQFERNLPFSLSDFPAAAEAPPQLGLLANDPFKPPINEQVLALYDLPGQRLHNLRSNLTLDGKPLDIPLFSPPTDPNQLLRDLAAGGAGAPRPMGGRLVVGAFRWRTTFEVALRAVQTLQEHGEQVLRLLERRDQIEQEDMQQNYLLELGAYAQTMQEQSLLQLQETKAALEQSQAVAQEREDAYKRLYEENVSAVEYKVMDNLYRSKILSTTSASIRPGGAAIAALANIFGVANGGFRLDKVYDVASFALDIAAAVLQIDAEKQATTESYRRRREEWQLQCDQAKAEVQAIEKQVAAQSHAVTAAQTSLDQTLIANSQALTVYNFLKKRATNAELYGWLLGQFKALHYQAYDAVVSLCLSAQASLSAETGDYDTQIPLPQVWLDNRHGLTAGEHLRAHLMRMEREYLQRFERRLELVKTISLRQLFDDENDPQTGIESWEVALQALRTKGTLEFKLTQLLFDRDYPGHYCRQIDSVEVDLPVLTGPYDNVRATLRQISSMTATKASVRSVDYLHRPEEAVAPTEVQINLRSGQQIALSLGIGDSGMTALKPEESLLNPFENTGVVSRWMLTFPRPGKKPQCDMLRSLTDIIVRLRYTAKAGESPFARAVEDRVTELDPGAAECTPVEGAGRHE